MLPGVSIEGPNQVWSTDITCLPIYGGFLYLVAVMDWFSCSMISWKLSNTMETGICLTALEAAFRFGQPEIWNSDQGSQFTAAEFLMPLQDRAAFESGWTARGRALDKVFAQRSGLLVMPFLTAFGSPRTSAAQRGKGGGYKTRHWKPQVDFNDLLIAVHSVHREVALPLCHTNGDVPPDVRSLLPLK